MLVLHNKLSLLGLYPISNDLFIPHVTAILNELHILNLDYKSITECAEKYPIFTYNSLKICRDGNQDKHNHI